MRNLNSFTHCTVVTPPPSKAWMFLRVSFTNKASTWLMVWVVGSAGGEEETKREVESVPKMRLVYCEEICKGKKKKTEGDEKKKKELVSVQE